MFRLLLLSMVCTPLLSWWHEMAPYSPPEPRLPIVLMAQPARSSDSAGGFDSSTAQRRILQGAADRLRARGVMVWPRQMGDFVVFPDSSGDPGLTQLSAFGEQLPSGNEAITLSVRLSGDDTAVGYATETHFGGSGDEGWRLASRVQQHLVSGLRDVLGYHTNDRGILEHGESSAPPVRPEWSRLSEPWVTACPLLAASPTELAQMQSPDTLDLFASALADAISDYLSPAVPTPLRDPTHGWRQFAPWRPLPPSLVVEAEHSPRVALTFDAASYPPLRPAILDALRDAGVRSTIFLTGDFVDAYPEAVVQMVRDGHEIGNHSDTHPDMPSISSSHMVSELAALDAKIVRLTGRSTRPWFRPPSGAYSDLVLRVAGQQGYSTIYWTADSADWRTDVDAATVRQRLLQYAVPGAILVAHLTSPQTAEVLPEVLQILKAKGVQFGTVSELLGTPY